MLLALCLPLYNMYNRIKIPTQRELPPMPSIYRFDEGDLVWMPDFAGCPGDPYRMIPGMIARISSGNAFVTYPIHRAGGVVDYTSTWFRAGVLSPRGDYLAGVDL